MWDLFIKLIILEFKFPLSESKWILSSNYDSKTKFEAVIINDQNWV